MILHYYSPYANFRAKKLPLYLYMANQYFRFKQFTVWHDQCAMKVGTDGVLLGSWVNCRNTNRILDVGTGSGLIALMCAQRSTGHIDAIDICHQAYNQATFNVSQSIFTNRIKVFLQSYEEFFTDKKYDLIVSNPPYFEKSLKSPDKNRNIARHNDTSLSFDVLISKSVQLLSDTGKLSVIIPADSFETLHKIASFHHLNLNRKTLVKPKPDATPKRVLTEYSFNQVDPEGNEIAIELSRHIYTPEYISLTKDFYLHL